MTIKIAFALENRNCGNSANCYVCQKTYIRCSSIELSPMLQTNGAGYD